MTIKIKIFIPIIIIIMSVTWNQSSAGQKENIKIENVIEVMTEIMNIPEKGIPPALLNKAQGIAVIPGVIKLGFIIGGRYGNGVIIMKNKSGTWTNPSFISLTGGSLGWQIGAQSTDIILVFKNRKSIYSISDGKFTLGADAAIAAGPIGRQVSASTDIQLTSEIYSYSRSRGLFAGLALEGAVLQIDYKANAAFYNRNISADEIFKDKGIQLPGLAEKFRQILIEYDR
ncbi:SH3 domain-containing YSC84-like protein 1 [Candidatus Magnetomoraceae bacterium gMMP-15]